MVTWEDLSEVERLTYEWAQRDGAPADFFRELTPDSVEIRELIERWGDELGQARPCALAGLLSAFLDLHTTGKPGSDLVELLRDPGVTAAGLSAEALAVADVIDGNDELEAQSVAALDTEARPLREELYKEYRAAQRDFLAVRWNVVQAMGRGLDDDDDDEGSAYEGTEYDTDEDGYAQNIALTGAPQSWDSDDEGSDDDDDDDDDDGSSGSDADGYSQNINLGTIEGLDGYTVNDDGYLFRTGTTDLPGLETDPSGFVRRSADASSDPPGFTTDATGFLRRVRTIDSGYTTVDLGEGDNGGVGEGDDGGVGGVGGVGEDDTSTEEMSDDDVELDDIVGEAGTSVMSGTFSWASIDGTVFVMSQNRYEQLATQRAQVPDGTWEEWIRSLDHEDVVEGGWSDLGVPENGFGLITLSAGQVVNTSVSDTEYTEAPKLGQNVAGPLDTEEIDRVNGINLGNCARAGSGATVSIIGGFSFVLIGEGHSFNAMTNAYMDLDTGERIEPPAGVLQFKRNRTSANEFILSGDDRLLDGTVQRWVRRALATDASTYPHRDGERVRVHR